MLMAPLVVVLVEEVSFGGLARREVRVGGESEAGFLERDVGIRGGKDVRLR